MRDDLSYNRRFTLFEKPQQTRFAGFKLFIPHVLQISILPLIIAPINFWLIS
jgi:hypothetical protein